MFAKLNPIATLGVKNIDAAKKFYEDTLGLTQQPAGGPFVVYPCGNGALGVYESEFAGTNEATAVTWTIDNDIEGFVKSLAEKGVKFEHYDFPGAKREGDMHYMGPMKNAWFKDPDGNIHSLVSVVG